MINRRIAIKRTAASLAAFSAVGSVLAQEDSWPHRPITLVIPESAGSGTDLLARVMAQSLGAALKQSIIVENKPGASGIIGTQYVVKAAPDGYTLLYTNASFAVIAPALLINLPYSMQRDLVPVVETAAGGVILLVSDDFPAKNLKELIAVVKANPNKYTYGSWAVGSSGNLAMEWLKKQTGMEVSHVPYNKMSQMLTELISGTIKIGWADPASPIPFINSGQLRAIAVTGDIRLPNAPNVPTMSEQGYPFDTVGWFGIFAPAGTPKQVVERINGEVIKIQAEPSIVKRIHQWNISVPSPQSPNQFRALVAHDSQVWKKIVTEAGLKPHPI